MLICQYCNKECKSKNSHTNHERTCPGNPNRNYKNGMTGKTAWNKGLTAETNSTLLARSISDKEAYKDGSRVITGFAAFTKEKRSSIAKQQGFGGYRENAGRSKKFYYNDSFGKKVCLQSTYELKCAEILDDLDIKWIRPTYIKYNGNKKYFPDFYLVDYNIYLDPKNNFLAKKDHEKISCVCDQNNVKVLILTEDNLTKEFIKNATESER